MQAKSNNYLAVGMMAAGFLLIVLSWNGAAGFDTVQQQFPYLLSGGLSGLALIGGGIGLSMVRELRRGTAVIEAKLDELIKAAPALDAEATTSTTLVTNGNLTERQVRALERAGKN